LESAGQSVRAWVWLYVDAATTYPPHSMSLSCQHHNGGPKNVKVWPGRASKKAACGWVRAEGRWAMAWMPLQRSAAWRSAQWSMSTVCAKLLWVTHAGRVGRAKSQMLPSVSSAAWGRSWFLMYSMLSGVVASMSGVWRVTPWMREER
jgi:hypothetical protein